MEIAGERAVETDGSNRPTLGERIVAAARMAVAVHLFESLAATTGNYGQQFAIGGAGPVAPATADRVHSRRPFRIGGGDETRPEDEGEAGSR
jgi:hypothetical protein